MLQFNEQRTSPRSTTQTVKTHERVFSTMSRSRSADIEARSLNGNTHPCARHVNFSALQRLGLEHGALLRNGYLVAREAEVEPRGHHLLLELARALAGHVGVAPDHEEVGGSLALQYPLERNKQVRS